jgi:hypothetical protein
MASMHILPPVRVFGLAALAFLASSPLFSEEEFGKDPEAFYLSALGEEKKVELAVVETAGLYADRKQAGFLGNAVKGDKVLLVAYHPEACLVKAGGKTEGWILTRALSPVEPELIDELKAGKQEKKQFQEAIKDKEILPGMTFDDVKKAKGKPDKISFRKDENGQFDKWSYLTYESVTYYRQIRDEQNRLISIPYRKKIPVGSFDIEFKNGRVAAIEQVNLPRN